MCTNPLHVDLDFKRAFVENKNEICFIIQSFRLQTYLTYFTHSIVILIQRMLVKLGIEPKFQKYFREADFKYSQKQSQAIKQHINTQTMKITYANPFIVKELPKYSREQLAPILLLIGKNTEQMSIRNFNFNYFQVFISLYFKDLVEVLSAKEFHCQIFCLALCRFLQEFVKTNDLVLIVNKIKSSRIVDLLLRIYDEIKRSQNPQKKTQPKKHLVVLFQAIIGYASVKYISQIGEDSTNEDQYISKAMRISILSVQSAQNESDFEVVREFVNFTSHLLIFNSQSIQPLKFFEFCLFKNQGLMVHENNKVQEIQSQIQKQYFESVVEYIKLDPQYMNNLLKMMKNFLQLKIKSQIIMKHFDALIQIVKLRLFPELKLKIYKVLLEVEDKKSCELVDRLLQDLIASDPDLCYKQTQDYNLKLAQKGHSNRKKKFVQYYYNFAIKNHKRLKSKSVNFIFQVNLDHNLNLPQFEVYVSREASILQSPAIRKLHQAINRYQNKAHLNYLQIILSKKLEKGFKKIKQFSQTNPFLQQEWLEDAGKCFEVYEIYLSNIVAKVGSKTLEIQPKLINLNSCIIKIQNDCFAKGLEYYCIISKMAIKYQVFSPIMFKYMLICQAIFGDRLEISCYKYFFLCFSKIAQNDPSEIIFLLQYLVRLLKNKSSVLLYLQAILQLQRFYPEFYNNKLYDIEFLSILIEESNFFKISTYSFEAFTILHQLTVIIKDSHFQNNADTIFKAWSSLMSRNECVNFSYLFCFRQIKKIFPHIREKQGKNNRERIAQLWGLMIKLLDHERQPLKLLKTNANKILVHWKGDDSLKQTKKSLQIEGEILRNQNLDVDWNIFTLITTFKTYNILLINDRCIIYQKINTQSNKQLVKQTPIKQLKKNNQSIMVSLRIYEISNTKNKSKVTLSIAGQIIQTNYQGNLQEIAFQIDTQAFIRNLTKRNLLSCDVLQNISQHLNTLNQWSVKVASLAHINVEDFMSKIDFQHIFYLMGQILKNFKQWNAAEGFKMFIRFSCRLFKYLKKSAPHVSLPYEIQVMNNIFGLIRKGFTHLRSIPDCTFEIEFEKPTQYSYYLYHLYVSALLPEELWRFFSQQTKKYLLTLLTACLQNIEFRIIQNSNFELFQLLCSLDYECSEIMSITKNIILQHQPNNMLTFKFQHYISLCEYSHEFSKNLTELLTDLISCIDSDNPECIKRKALCKFLVIQTNVLDIVFTFCSAQSKISLIHYIVYNPINLSIQKNDKGKQQKYEIEKIKELVSTMSRQERSQFIGLLICQIQQDSLPRNYKRRLSNSVKKSNFLSSNKTNLENILYINLYLLVKHWDFIDNDAFEDVLVVLSKFLHSRVDFPDTQEAIHQQTQNTICTEQYVQFLYKIKIDIKQQHRKYEQQFNQIFKLSFQVICQSQKPKFIKFMKHYLQLAIQSLPFALLPLDTQIFKEIQLYSHSVILQYIYEVLIKFKYNTIYDEQFINEFSNSAISYVEFFTVNIQFAGQVERPLVYAYPKLVAIKQPSVQKLVAKIKEAQKEAYLQLKGGLYFKLILIVIELLQSCKGVDFTSIIQLLLLRKDGSKKSINSSKYSESNPNATYIFGKQESPLQKELLFVQEQHKKYYIEIQHGSLKEIPPLEYDLTYALMQFFLMRLCQFLQHYSDILEPQVLNSYSSLVISYLRHPKIAKEINEINQFTSYYILKYEDILYLLDPQTQTQMKSPLFQNFTPVGSPRKGSISFGNIVSSFGINNFSLGDPTSPQRRTRKKTADFTNISKERIELYEELLKDPRGWAKLPKKTNFAKNFGAKPKEIRFIQFLHIHNILKGHHTKKLFFDIDKSKELTAFIKNHGQHLRMYKKTKECNKVQKNYALRKVKKIFPYTSPSRTVIRIMDISFSNMTCPITQLIECKDYSLRKISSKQSINMQNYLGEDEENNNEPQNSFEESLKDYLNEVELEEEELKESAEQLKKGKQFCQLVTRQGVYFCQWQLLDRQKKLKLKPLDTRPQPQEFPYLIYGSPEDNLIKKNLTEQIIHFHEIEQIFYRKFAQFVNSIEIFMKNGTSRFIVFYKIQILGLFMKIFQKVHKTLKIVKEPHKQFSQLNYTQRWIDGNLSNFDYIMLLNKYSGRTHNDLNQYYIFPWVLKDYQSDKIDLSDSDIYRDLSRPIGAQNPQKLKRFKDIYRGNMGSHFYGSHYSTSLFVLYYLVRLQPFSTLHRDMQKGSFDLADRLFSSIFQVWDTLMSESATSDIKELIPQFYYMPAILKNIANIELGQKMCGQVVSDVDLPPWASTPEQFVVTMRAALQSDWVSENLHLWIDLIFGKHQCSQQKFNVFLSQTYQQKVREKFKQLKLKPRQLQGHIHQIIYFGQCPSKLFNKQHKPKKINLDSLPRRSSLKVKRPLSQTTTSQHQYQQALVMPGWKVSQIYVQNNRFYLQLQNKSGKIEYAQAAIQFFCNFDELKQSLQDLKMVSKRRQQSRIRNEDKKLHLQGNCLKMGNQIVIALEINFSYENVKVNEMWIVCYGLSGLRVYNWQQQIFWKWQKQEVCSVHLQATRMIYSTPSGKVCFYSFFDQRLHQTQAIRQCSAMEIKVVSFPRLPSRMYKNQTQYKVLCVGDQQRVTIVDHLFEQTFNYTSSLRAGLN